MLRLLKFFYYIELGMGVVCLQLASAAHFFELCRCPPPGTVRRPHQTLDDGKEACICMHTALFLHEATTERGQGTGQDWKESTGMWAGSDLHCCAERKKVEKEKENRSRGLIQPWLGPCLRDTSIVVPRSTVLVRSHCCSLPPLG